MSPTSEEQNIMIAFEHDLRQQGPQTLEGPLTVKNFYVPTNELLGVAQEVFGNLREKLLQSRQDPSSNLTIEIWHTADPYTVFIERKTPNGQVVSRVIEKRSPECMAKYLEDFQND